MTVRRIAGHTDRDPVARFEHRKKRQDESAGGAGRDHDPVRLHLSAVSILVVSRDAGAQRGNAERGGVIDPSLIERGMRRRNRRSGGRRRRLPYFHVNHVPAGRLDPRRGRHHVHHHEGRNIAPSRRRQQVIHTVSQGRIEHGYLQFEGTPPISGSRPRLPPQTGRIRWLLIVFSSKVNTGSGERKRLKTTDPKPDSDLITGDPAHACPVGGLPPIPKDPSCCSALRYAKRY
jgi:hypothetical protein